MEADERAEAARHAKEAGNDAYHKSFLETAVDHYTRGALLDPSDISFLTNRAAAYLCMCKYKECVRDCDDAVKRGRELGAGNKLIARALSRKASALLELAGCAGDYAPAIRALQQSLAEHYSEETLDVLDKAESARKELEEQERLDQEAADHHRERGNEFFKQKKYHEAAMHYTQAMKMNPKDPRVFSNRVQCHIYLGSLPQGLEDAEKCVELDPTFLKGYVRKAKVQFLMENYENALATYLEGLRCDPNSLEVLDGLRRCAACIKRANGGDVELEDLKEMSGNFRSEDDLGKLQKAMEQAAIFKKEASDERLRRIECERMARTMEEYLSGVQQELERLKKQHGEVTEKLRKASEHNENLQGQLSESRGQFDWLLSVVEAMQDTATIPSASSSRSVSDENCTPSYFICPILQDVMNDPHIAADGFTYEAEAIRSWLDSGHDTSPMTNVRLERDELIPNHALRSAIQEWLQQQNMA